MREGFISTLWVNEMAGEELIEDCPIYRGLYSPFFISLELAHGSDAVEDPFVSPDSNQMLHKWLRSST